MPDTGKLEIVLIPCELCKKPFHRKKYWQRFCSSLCKNRSYHLARTICPKCGGRMKCENCSG